MEVDIQANIDALPLTSGVYLMKDAQGDVIYVGKAVSLRKRVQSYFRKKRHYNKTDLLVKDAVVIDYIETSSEAEALILEASLIKQYDPKYNVELRDDKSYPYIEVSADKYPRISVCRPRAKKKGARYYGPYVNAVLVREALKILRKIFYFLTDEKLDERVKLDYQIGLADAPTVEEMDARKYNDNVKNVCLILEGKKDELYRRLQHKMDTLAQAKEFEEAAKARDQLRAIGALYSGTKDVNYFKEAEQVQRALGLPRLPMRIECFDISNIMGNQAVGSMVSFFNGKPDKGNYRRFKIKEVAGIDDFKMIAEIVRRRYSRLKREGAAFPDLIVIDGGKGQLSAAWEQLVLAGVDIPVVSLAKREEELFLPRKRGPVRMAKDSLGLNLLMRIRDEAHRFAITYHRQLRGKDAFSKS